MYPISNLFTYIMDADQDIFDINVFNSSTRQDENTSPDELSGYMPPSISIRIRRYNRLRAIINFTKTRRVLGHWSRRVTYA